MVENGKKWEKMGKVTKSGFFLGEYRYRLDDKNRLLLPKRIRVEIDAFEVVLSKGFEPYIAGFDIERWRRMSQEPLSIPGYEEKGRQLRRQIFASAVILELDSLGRMVLPESLVRWAHLEESKGKELVVIGAGDHFEIWTETNWKQYLK
ncbi:hypothetical protein C4579_01865 [Candidatus Microgenomates bacterium]|nr:MAG: hypothetical protein C4579_01865 [Candidatus Microgenomates bacterium]